MIPIRTLLAACLLALSPFAHGFSQEDPLSMIYELVVRPQPTIPNVEQSAPAPMPRLEGCRLPIRNIEDVRPNKQTVGALILETAGVPHFMGSLTSGDGTRWLKGAVESLRPPGPQLPPAGASDGEGVDVGLRLAHAWLGGVNIHSHVVLQAKFRAESGQIRRYHGFASKVNGIGANAEFMTTLNMAMEDALRRWAADLQKACRGEAL